MIIIIFCCGKFKWKLVIWLYTFLKGGVHPWRRKIEAFAFFLDYILNCFATYFFFFSWISKWMWNTFKSRFSFRSLQINWYSKISYVLHVDKCKLHSLKGSSMTLSWRTSIQDHGEVLFLEVHNGATRRNWGAQYRDAICKPLNACWPVQLVQPDGSADFRLRNLTFCQDNQQSF